MLKSFGGRQRSPNNERQNDHCTLLLAVDSGLNGLWTVVGKGWAMLTTVELKRLGNWLANTKNFLTASYNTFSFRDNFNNF